MKKIQFLINRFLKWARACLAKSTVDVYRHYFRRFVEYHGNMLIAKLKPMHLSEWAKTWHEAQAMKRLFNWALVDAELVKRNPFANVKHPPKGERKRIMGRAEMLAFLRSTSLDLRTLLLAHRETFARPQELRVATWESIQCEDRSITLQQSLQSGKACIVLHEFKARKRRRIASAPRVILLSPRVCRLLLRILERSSDAVGPIFRTAAGKAWSSNAVRCRLRRLRKRNCLTPDKHGENIVPYTFRHTGATLASAAGIRDRVLADILGHVETSTTHRYQHLSVDHLRAALAPLWNGELPR